VLKVGDLARVTLLGGPLGPVNDEHRPHEHVPCAGHNRRMLNEFAALCGQDSL
jgi:hypothetical protein